MTLSLTWTPDPTLLTNLVKIATRQGKTIESVLFEAVQLYLENQPLEPLTSQSDRLIGLFKDSSNLATKSEDTLQRE